MGSNTVPEYVTNRLLEIEGIGQGDFDKQEIKKLPVRYEMMTSGNVGAAAALPATLLALGEINGCTTIMDDAHDAEGKNLSQSVVVVREAFEDDTEAARTPSRSNPSADGRWRPRPSTAIPRTIALCS